MLALMRARMVPATILLLIVSAALSACETSVPPTATPGGDAGVRITISTDPTPPRSGDVTVIFTIMDAGGKPVTDADSQVHIKIDMPTMSHKPIEGNATYAGDGKWRASGRFTMGGQWRAVVVVTRNGETLATRDVRLDVRG